MYVPYPVNHTRVSLVFTPQDKKIIFSCNRIKMSLRNFLAFSGFAMLTLALPPALHKKEIKCLEVGAIATASWVDLEDRTCTFVGVVGNNFGTNENGE